MKKVLLLPTCTSSGAVVVRPFMSETMQRTVLSPAVFQLLVAVELLFAVVEPSPQSQK